MDLLRETMKVALDSAGPNEPLKCYHNCEVCVLRNGKGSRDGIAIPERPARYVEEKEEEVFDTPILATPFYMDTKLEDAPVREKMGRESSDGKPRRKHRGGRRSRNKSGAETAAQQPAPKAEATPQEEKKGGQKPRPHKAPKAQQPAPQPGAEVTPRAAKEREASAAVHPPRPPPEQGRRRGCGPQERMNTTPRRPLCGRRFFFEGIWKKRIF